MDSELSALEIDELSDKLLVYLQIVGATFAEEVADSYRVVASENLIYGVRRGELFQREFDSSDQFDDAFQKIQRDLGESQERHERDRVERLLHELELEVERAGGNTLPRGETWLAR